MSDDEMLKMHIHYGGVMSKDGYSSGSIAPDMLVDPDLLTFSIFEDFTKCGEVVSDVEKLWYRLPNEDMSMARSIWEDKDKEVMKMALEAKVCGEVYIYIKHRDSLPNVDGASSRIDWVIMRAPTLVLTMVRMLMMKQIVMKRTERKMNVKKVMMKT